MRAKEEKAPLLDPAVPLEENLGPGYSLCLFSSSYWPFGSVGRQVNVISLNAHQAGYQKPFKLVL